MTASQVARVLIRVGGAMMALVLPAMERVQKRIVDPSDRVARGRYRIAPDVGPRLPAPEYDRAGPAPDAVTAFAA
jgi:hypothetical protein